MERNKTCRLCLAEVPISYSLLENDGLNILESLTSIKITEDDGFSKHSCIKCWLKIKLAYQIQQSILEADRKLHLYDITIKEEINPTVSTFENDSNGSTDKSLATIKSEILSRKAFESFHDVCPICNKKDDSVFEHLKSHFSVQKCHECDISFEDMLSYRNHVNTMHNLLQKKLICSTCKLTFHYKNLYDFHTENAHNNDVAVESTKESGGAKKRRVIGINRGIRLIKIYPTVPNTLIEPVCKQPKIRKVIKKINKPTTKTNKTEHLISKALLDCQKPAKVLPTPLEYDSEGNIKCHECVKTFATRRSFAAHRASHVKKLCPICKAEITAINLSRHIDMHSARSVVCHICGAVSKNIESLRGHLYYTHSTRQYKCEHCGKIFKKLYIRDLHVKKEHTGEKGHICDTCGKCFFTQHCLNKHIKMTHLKLRPFKCTYCEKGFCSKHALRTHIRQHTNEAPYICTICGEGFRQNVSLKAHKRSKHKIIEKKDFACKVCHKMFVDAWAVKSHMRLHL